MNGHLRSHVICLDRGLYIGVSFVAALCGRCSTKANTKALELVIYG